MVCISCFGLSVQFLQKIFPPKLGKKKFTQKSERENIKLTKNSCMWCVGCMVLKCSNFYIHFVPLQNLIFYTFWACGAVGSALALQARGHRFESGLVQVFLFNKFFLLLGSGPIDRSSNFLFFLSS